MEIHDSVLRYRGRERNCQMGIGLIADFPMDDRQLLKPQATNDKSRMEKKFE